MTGKPKLAIVVSHPIQHFAPLYREVASRAELELRVFFCCDWGVKAYFDSAFGREIQWDVPLLDGYDHEFLPIRVRPRRISFWDVDNPEVSARLSAFNPDAVLVHGYGCRTMWRAVSWTRRSGRPALLTSDSQASRRGPLWKRLLKRVVVRRFYDQLDGALAAGDENSRYHAEYGLPPERIFPVTLPVDGSRLVCAAGDREEARRAVRERLGIPLHAFVALFCGNLTPWKRPIDFVRAVAGTAGSDEAVWGILLGDGPQRPAVQAELEQVGARNVRLAGFVNQSQIGPYYAASDALVVTSDRDAHPLVVTEALFFGLPIVVSDAVGCIGQTDTARPGENARVFRCGRVAELGALLVALARQPEERTRLGRASLAISSEHDAGASARLLLRAVDNVLRLGTRVEEQRRQGIVPKAEGE